MAATTQMQWAGGAASEPAGVNCETGLTLSRDDALNGTTPIPIPTATGTNYSWFKNLMLAVTATSSTTISARQIAISAPPTTGLGIDWRASLAPATPAAPTLVPSASGGTMAAGTTYNYRISALNAAGETLAGPEAAGNATTTGTTGSIAVSWTAVTGASGGYKIYGRTAAGELYMATVAAGVTTWTDTGAITPAGALPAGNTATAYLQPAVGNMPAAAVTNDTTPTGWTAATTVATTYDAASVSAGSTGRNGGFVHILGRASNLYVGGAGSAIALPNISISYTES